MTKSNAYVCPKMWKDNSKYVGEKLWQSQKDYLNTENDYEDKFMQQGARAIILQKGKILLGKRLKKDSFYGQWCTFGGRSKIGETTEETLQRELFEELGIHIQNPKFITVVEYKLPKTRQKIKLYFYVVKNWNGEITNKSEHIEIKWFFLDELKDLSLGRLVCRVIEHNFKDFLPYNPFSQ